MTAFGLFMLILSVAVLAIIVFAAGTMVGAMQAAAEDDGCEECDNRYALKPGPLLPPGETPESMQAAFEKFTGLDAQARHYEEAQRNTYKVPSVQELWAEQFAPPKK